jgi:tetratricopeptide (TPR) repeat protein
MLHFGVGLFVPHAVSGPHERQIRQPGSFNERRDPMKKLFVLALVLCLTAPAFAAAQEKPPSPFQIYSKDQTPENFVNAYDAYNAQLKDTMNYGTVAMLGWLSYYELERNLEVLKANTDKLTDMNKFQYANILLELGRYDEAIPLYAQINEHNAKWSCPWRHKGTALWKKGELDAAAKSLEMAIETRKTHYDAYVILAHVYNDMKEYKKAAATLETGLSYYGKDSEDPEKEMTNLEVQFFYLDVLKKAGEKAKYKEQHEKLLKLVPDDERLKK